MNIKIVKLRFLRPFHLSMGKPDAYESSERLLHSDTLQAALFATACQLYGCDVAEDFRNKVVVSSAFPYTDSEGYWLPRPVSYQPDNPERRKEIKKKQYLKTKQFQQLVHGENLAVDEFLSSPDPIIWREETTQRVLIDRVNSRGMPYYLEKLYPFSGAEEKMKIPFHDDRGLYLIIAMPVGEFNYLDPIFRLLGETGIGLNRTLGNGIFDYEIIDNPSFLQLPKKAKYWMNFSLFRPRNEDINSSNIRLDESKYQLIKRGGWIASPQFPKHSSLRKKAVVMFREGSVFSFPMESNPGLIVKGKLENVRPDWNDPTLHDVWRDGRSIFLPLNS